MALIAGLLGGVVALSPVAADLPEGQAQAGDRDDPVVAIAGDLPAGFARRIEVRSQTAALTVRPAGQPASLDLSDQIAGATVTTDIFRSVNGRAWSVSASVTMRAVATGYDDPPPDYLVVGLGQGSAAGCTPESFLVFGGTDYDTPSYSFNGYFADGAAAVPPATLWTCALAYSAYDANGDGPVGDPPLDQVQNALTNVMGSEALVIPGLGKNKVVKGAWTGFGVPVVNQGNVVARQVRLDAKAKGAKVRIKRVLATLDVGETDYVPVEVKLTSRSKAKVTFTARSADGVVAGASGWTLKRTKAPRKPTVGRYQSTQGADVSWKIDRKRKLSGFKVPLNIYCDGNLNPYPGVFRLPKFKVPKHGVVSKTFKDGIFTNELYLTIKGDDVPYGYFARYTDGLLTGQQACSGQAEFTAKWVGR